MAHLAAAEEGVSYLMVVDDDSDDAEETQPTASMAVRFNMSKDEDTSSFTRKLDADGRPNIRYYKPRQTTDTQPAANVRAANSPMKPCEPECDPKTLSKSGSNHLVKRATSDDHEYEEDEDSCDHSSVKTSVIIHPNFRDAAHVEKCTKCGVTVRTCSQEQWKAEKEHQASQHKRGSTTATDGPKRNTLSQSPSRSRPRSLTRSGPIGRSIGKARSSPKQH